MRKIFNLREITESDWKVLLEWRNDKNTRQNSFNSDLISVSEHKEFIKNTITNTNRTQFILEYNEIPVGTIREDRLGKDELELSYTISPMYRGKKIGQIMMSLYLIERSGSFLCEVKEENVPSIKMIEKLGFKFFKKENEVNFYKLNQSHQSS
jgi:UDP-2,4-diacetamido-2,4,6-trideoxy-beta-L-altropyranose hydrolase